MVVKTWLELLDAILLRKLAFLVTFFLVFLSSYAFLAWIDFLPELVNKEAVTESLDIPENKNLNIEENSLQQESIENIVATSSELTTVSEVFPVTMTIPALDKSVSVLNPSSRNIADLDEALLNGVVRHPDSATLDQDGTVFILGHSSYLPVVHNKNFQALNGIQNLKWGDTITLSSIEGDYVYRVDKVYRVKAAEVTVPIAGLKQRLYLATCNSFGSTDDRYVVEAELIETRLF